MTTGCIMPAACSTRSASTMDREAHVAGAGLTDDAFLGGRLQVLQPARGFRSGIDAVLLAAAAPAAAGERVLDLGTGAGVAAVCLARRVDGVAVTGVEIQPDLCALASTNAERIALSGAVVIVEADVCAPARAVGEAI